MFLTAFARISVNMAVLSQVKGIIVLSKLYVFSFCKAPFRAGKHCYHLRKIADKIIIIIII